MAISGSYDSPGEFETFIDSTLFPSTSTQQREDTAGVFVATPKVTLSVMVAVGVNVAVKVFVPPGVVYVIVTVGVSMRVKVALPPIIVGVDVKVGVNVGDPHTGRIIILFESCATSGADPLINAWFVIEAQVFTVPHHVKVPPSLDTVPRFHFATCAFPE